MVCSRISWLRPNLETTTVRTIMQLILFSALFLLARSIQVSAELPEDGLDEKNVVDYPLPEFGSGSGPLVDDEDYYSYVGEQLQLQPSSPKVPDVPSPTLAYQLDSEMMLFASESATPVPTPTPTTTLSAVRVTSSNHLPPPELAAAPPRHSQNPSSSISNNDWIHIGEMGSGDSTDINPTPTLDVASPTPSTAIVLSQNQPPRVTKPVQKIQVNGGHFKKERIDTHFQDDTDLNLKYSVNTNDKWIYILGNELLMLPSVEDVSDYEFNLTAEDSEGLSVNTPLFISVRQPSKSRQWFFYYEFTFPAFHNWREVMHSNMSHHAHGSGHGNFIVRKVTQEGNLISLQYVNETLMDFHACPIERIQAVGDHYRKIYPDFHYVLLPEMICESFRVVNTSKINNYPPSIKNQIDFINCSNGELIVYKVPDDFCYDPEEGGTGNLHLDLVDFNYDPLKPSNWLQFDTKNREFFGIYVDKDVDSGAPGMGKPIGGVSGGKYVLVCRDSHGKEAIDVLDTWVSMPEEQFNAEFSLHFASNSFNPLQIRKFVEKLGSLFNSTPNQIKIKSYTMDNNIVHFTWFNKSNPGEKEITQLRKVLFSNEGPVSKKVVELFSPEFNITGGNILPIGRLIGEDTLFHFPNNNVPDGGTPATDSDGDLDEEVSIYSSYSGYLVTYIIPSVLIAVMVLLSLIIACLLSRKKKLPGDGNEIRKVGGGVPVIFQDELEVEHPLLHSSTSPPPAKPIAGSSSTGTGGDPGRATQPPPPPQVHRAASGTPPPIKYPHPPPGYKSVAKYEPPLPPVQYSTSANKYHHNSNSGILPPPYVPP